MSCHINETTSRYRGKFGENKIIIALAGNANVGKSVIFNQLTGLHQHVGNWPGKTVKKAEGTLVFDDYEIDVVDLPGIYSLSVFSLEESVSREFIALEHPDAIINVVDASALERNLFFTIQLLEMEPHLIIALNQMDLAGKKGININSRRLSEILGVPVIPTVGIKNIGLKELIVEAIRLHDEGDAPASPPLFGHEIEEIISDLIKSLNNLEIQYPLRWIAIKLLESDGQVEDDVYSVSPFMREKVESAKRRIEEIHGHDAPSVIASERYAQANRIASEVSKYSEPTSSLLSRVEDVTNHRIFGYIILLGIILMMFFSIFSFGDFSSGIFADFFEALKKYYFSVSGDGWLQNFVWNGLFEGVIAGISIALPYIVPFFIALSILEDTGYMARVAFLMDSLMHRIGLHGKGFIPLMLGFGCNVPACLGCSIMETERERVICAFVASLVPCAARSIVIMGLVATYLGFEWALFLYALDFLLIFILGRIAFKALPGEPVGLIMEMPPYRWPTVRMTAQRMWFRLKYFIYEAFPIMVAGNLAIFIANALGILNYVEVLFTPVTVWWLGLPATVGVVLIFGVLRKELTLILLASIIGTTNFASILTPAQMFVFAFVVMIYIPCIATIAVLVREFGAKIAAIISVTEIVLAVTLGGLVWRTLLLFGVS